MERILNKKKHWITDRQWTYIIVFISLSIRILYLLDVQKDPISNVLILDSLSYQKAAIRFLTGGGFPKEVFFQSPFYPIFLAAVYRIFGIQLDIVRLIQILLDVCSIIMVMRYTKLLFGRKAGIIAGLGMCFYPVLIFQSCLILKTTLNVFFCALILNLVFIKRTLKQSLFLGLFLGLAATNQGSMILFVPLVVIWLILSRGVISFKKWAFDLIMFAIGLGFIVGPVAYRNWKVSGEFVLLTAQGGANFYLGNSPYSDGTSKRPPHIRMTPEYEKEDFHREAERLSGRKLSAHEASSFWFNEGIKWIRENPRKALKLQIRKFLLFWNKIEIPDNYDFEFYRRKSIWIEFPRYPFLFLGICSISGMFFLVKEWRKLWFLYFWIVEYSLVIIAFHVYSRYRLPVIVALWPFAAHTIVYIFDHIKERKTLFKYVVVMALVGIIQSVSLAHYTLAQTYFNRGVAWEKKGNVKMAEKLYIKALRVKSDYSPAYVNLGKLYFQQHNIRLAKKYFEKALQLNPESAELQNNLGIIELNQGHYLEAEKYFEKAVKTQPYYFLGWLHLGQIRQIIGDDLGAIQCFKEALKLNANNSQALYGLAKVLDDMGNPEAVKTWELYIKSAQNKVTEKQYVNYALSRIEYWQALAE